MEFTGQNASEVWYKAVVELMGDSTFNLQSSRAGETRELLHVLMKITDSRQRWLNVRSPSINPAFALVEVVWIVCGREDSKFLNYWNTKLPTYAGYAEYYHGAYGNRLRSQFGFDQLERAYLALKHNPNSRQVVLQIWDPNADFPQSDGNPAADDIPCNTSSMLKVRGEKLEWTQIMRSNDVMRGLPYNILQFTSLQEIVAGWLELEVGSYHHFSDSLHVYQRDIDAFHFDELTHFPSNTDSLILPKEASDRTFAHLSTLIENFINNEYTESQILGIVEKTNLPDAYHNWLRVIAAEQARRNGWQIAAKELMASNSNPALQYTWGLWEARFAKKYPMTSA